jgi:hypothetical protein
MAELIFLLVVSFACGYGIREWMSRRRRRRYRQLEEHQGLEFADPRMKASKADVVRPGTTLPD